MPCFSTVVTTITASGLDHHHLPPPPVLNMYGRSTARGVARSVFPSFCSLQENLQLPFFLSMLVLPVGGAATAAMVCHGGVHHRVEEMGGNGWPSDLEWKADIYASISELKPDQGLSFPEKLRLGSRRQWPWMTPRPWISSKSLLSTSSPPAPPLPSSTPPPSLSPIFPSPVAMDDPKTLDLVKELVSTSSPPAPPLPPSTPPPLPPSTFPSPVAMDNPKILDLVKKLVVHLLSTRSPSPSIDPSAIATADLPVAAPCPPLRPLPH